LKKEIYLIQGVGQNSITSTPMTSSVFKRFLRTVSEINGLFYCEILFQISFTKGR